MLQDSQNLKRQIRFYLFQLPFTLIVIPIGFIFEFIITLPFVMIGLAGGLSPRNRPVKKN